MYEYLTHSKEAFTIGNNGNGSIAEDTALVQSLLRGLEILRRLAPTDHGMTLRETAAALELKEATTYKLLQTLVAAGFVEKTPRPVHYQLSSGVLELADTYWHRSLLRRAEEVVEELFEELRPHNANVVLAEAVGGEIETVLRMSPERPGIIERPRGRLMSPYASACSLAYQAFWTERERVEYQRRHPFWEQGEYLWDTPERLEELFDEIRRLGYAVPVFRTKNIYLVAAPVFAANKQLVAVLGASLPEAAIPEDEWREHVKHVVDAARQLSASE